MKIVVVDGFTANPGDLSWEALQELGETTVHARSAPDEVVERCAGAGAVLTNKVPFDRDRIAELGELRYLGILATGFDIVDLEACRGRGVAVANVPAYSTASVAQATVAHLLRLAHRVADHARDVAAGGWSAQPDFTYRVAPLVELEGRVLGLVGYGAIARRVARIALDLGMEVVATAPSRREGRDGAVEFVDFDALLARADAVSLHCPLTPATERLIDRDALARMKEGAWLINTARGGLVDPDAAAAALVDGRLGGAGIDVLEREPPPADHPLLAAPNCAVTPHCAWATREARARLIADAAANLRAFQAGERRNRVD